MKTSVIVLCFLCAATATFGQSVAGGSSLSAEPVIVQFVSHPGRAFQQTMGAEQNLLGQTANVQAHGVRPLWEVATPSFTVPLGDSARLLKKEHATAKKADIVWTN